MLKRILMVTAVGGVAAGCIDARGNFDQFADRVGFIDASTIDRPGGQLHDITGTFLYSTRAGFDTSNDPANYIQFILRAEMTINGDTATLTGTVTPLCVHSTCAVHRAELPPPFPTMQTTVNSDGTFESGFAGQMPGGSNPFSGTSQPLSTQVMGTIVSPDFLCGDITGNAAGLDLAGSTFAGQRITDTTPANLPVAISACPSGGPDAGVIDAAAIDAAAIDAGVDATVDAAVDAETDADIDAL